MATALSSSSSAASLGGISFSMASSVGGHSLSRSSLHSTGSAAGDGARPGGSTGGLRASGSARMLGGRGPGRGGGRGRGIGRGGGARRGGASVRGAAPLGMPAPRDRFDDFGEAGDGDYSSVGSGSDADGSGDDPFRPPSVAEINEYMHANPRADISDPAHLMALITGFVECNEVPADSPNLRGDEVDDMSVVMRLLGAAHASGNDHLCTKLLHMLKIMLRKLGNRRTIGAEGVSVLLQLMKAPSSGAMAKAGANVMLNLCYEEVNVDLVLDMGGVQPLVRLLESPDDDLRASVCGAIQSISFQERGRDEVREMGAMPMILSLLKSKHDSVLSRAVGALHNLSSDPASIAEIREGDGIEPLVALLSVPSGAVCGSAAGAIQNLSREPAAREMIRGFDAVPYLIDLLFACDVSSQACAAGALLNIIGPTLESEDPSNPERVAFKKLLSDSIALGAVAHIMTAGGGPGAAEAGQAAALASTPASSDDSAPSTPDSGAGSDGRRGDGGAAAGADAGE